MMNDEHDADDVMKRYFRTLATGRNTVDLRWSATALNGTRKVAAGRFETPPQRRLFNTALA